MRICAGARDGRRTRYTQHTCVGIVHRYLRHETFIHSVAVLGHFVFQPRLDPAQHKTGSSKALGLQEGHDRQRASTARPWIGSVDARVEDWEVQERVIDAVLHKALDKNTTHARWVGKLRAKWLVGEGNSGRHQLGHYFDEQEVPAIAKTW